MTKRKMGCTIFGQSFSSLACLYSVGMLRAAHKKSVGWEISKRDESDMARVVKRWVLCRSTAGQRHQHILDHRLDRQEEEQGTKAHLFFIAVLLKMRSNSMRDIMVL
jgi:anti-sigma-K factor RskA